MQFEYEARIKVKAARWTGYNLDEMRELLKDSLDKDQDGVPCVYAEWIEPYFTSSLGNRGGYYMLQTENDEFDPGVWIVVYEDGEYESMDDQEFTRMGFKKNLW